jgi:hypothetical protein
MKSNTEKQRRKREPGFVICRRIFFSSEKKLFLKNSNNPKVIISEMLTKNIFNAKNNTSH